MTIYYVATLACYVLVEAENELDAEVKGHPALHDLYAERSNRLGRDVPIHIVTIRPASSQEIELGKWHRAKLAEEAKHQPR